MKPNAIVHKTIELVVNSGYEILSKLLVKEANKVTGSKNSYGAACSLLTSKAKHKADCLRI